MSQALEQARCRFTEGTEQIMEQATKLLSIALRHALGLDGAFILVVSAPKAAATDGLVQVVSELLSLAPLELPTGLNIPALYQENEHLRFHRLAEAVFIRCTQGRGVLLQLPCMQAEHKYTLEQIAYKLRLPCLFVEEVDATEPRLRLGMELLSELSRSCISQSRL